MTCHVIGSVSLFLSFFPLSLVTPRPLCVLLYWCKDRKEGTLLISVSLSALALSVFSLSVSLLLHGVDRFTDG